MSEGTRSSVMSVQRWSEMDDQARADLLERGVRAIFDPELMSSISALVEDVADRGDAALVDALEKFDGCMVDAAGLRISDEEFERALEVTSDEVLEGIRLGIANIRSFNEELTREREWRFEVADGLEVGEKQTPIASAGLFVPSGKGSFPSVLVQIGTPAVVAGVPEIAVVVPPTPGGNGEVDPAVLCVARELELTDVFRANGPSGIAALALGTETIPKVRKVVGPGSPPVQAAQIACQLKGCHTQMLCGPSESLIIADESVDRDLLAADLLNEAEHGPDSSSLLVTDSEDLVEEVEPFLARRLGDLPDPRREYAAKALGENGGAIIVSDMEEATEVANLYAPEHMQIATSDDEAVLDRMIHAGEILIGQGTPVSFANYVAGVPAALPTGAYARVTGGITSETFMKKTSIARCDREALIAMGASVCALADHEGFPAHAAAIEARSGASGDKENEEGERSK